MPWTMNAMRPVGRAVPSRTATRVLALAAAAAVSACGGGGGGGGASAASPLYATTVDPADGASGVVTNAHVKVTFSLALDAASVTATSITVGDAQNGAVIGSTTVVPDGSGRTLEFAPTALMAGDTTFAVLLSTTLRSTAGDQV